ncbi:hypothetical protein QQ020_21690 [Fulvivirgaceae bacterium BMA12]|uniref:Uncharacterized protein n=1 Tax=Agaribacillus aureus TaxID=3051825 RepID=A0ABT8LCD9_9BACT|nr:hypothetical protein [Fulvivirgaceae bacterium BMA12]
MRKKTTLQLEPHQDYYEVGLKNRRYPWYLLLFLLILFIPITEELTFVVVDSQQQKPVKWATLNTSLDKGKNSLDKYSGQTDNDGMVSFQVHRQLLFTRLFNRILNRLRYPSHWILKSQALFACYEGKTRQEAFNQVYDSLITLNLRIDYANIAIHVIDSVSRRPIELAEVSVLSQKGISQAANMMTDGQGAASYHAVHCSDSLLVVAGKTGFSNDTVKLAMDKGYMVGADSAITLQLVRLPEDERCGTTMQASGGEGITIKAVNMLLDSGEFRFWYDAHSVPDEIKVYNGRYPNVDQQADLLFATNGCISGNEKHHLKFKHPSQFISIVIKGCEPGTSWNIEVDCPDF